LDRAAGVVDECGQKCRANRFSGGEELAGLVGRGLEGLGP
jgi:hypothetical protein